MTTPTVDIAIVGGGPVGLTAANLAGQLGLSTALFERNETTSFHPRGHVLNTRTMEIWRQVGMEASINDAALPIERHAGIGFVTSLAGEEIGHIRTRGDRDRDALERSWSPALKRSCPQDVIEPILREHAEGRRGVHLSFGTEVTGIEKVAEGYRLSWTGPDGRAGATVARYLIGADGPRSLVRDWLGIEMQGRAMGQQIGVYFHADLWKFIETRPNLLWWVYNARTTGVLIAMDGRTRWTFNFAYGAEESRHDYSEERCLGLIRAAIGEDVPVEIKSIMPWRMQARIADRMGRGRAFIAGDAAHPLPPTGGQGMNTGVADVHNLLWKIALVLRGVAPDSLLDSYDLERRPVAKFNVEQSARNAEAMAKSGLAGMLANDRAVSENIEGPESAAVRARLAEAIPRQRAHFDYPGQTFGYAYDSAWITPDGTPAVALDVETFTPSARPGLRAPHFPIRRDGVDASVLDLFDYGRFTLLATPGAADLATGLAAEADRIGVPCAAHVVGPGAGVEPLDTDWGALYGLGASGAVLVRPDGHVACRLAETDDASLAALTDALRAAIGARVADAAAASV